MIGPMNRWAFPIDESAVRGSRMSLSRVELDETTPEEGTAILDNYSGTNGNNRSPVKRTTATIEQAQCVMKHDPSCYPKVTSKVFWVEN